MADWKNIRLQYELLDQSVEDLAEENNIPVSRIKYAIEQEKWTRTPIADAVNDWSTIKGLDLLSDEALGDIQNRIHILNLLKTQALNPRYIALEAALLSKATELINTIDSSQPTAPAQLKSLAEIFETLVGKRQATPAPGSAEEPGKGGLRIYVNNRFEPEQIEGKGMEQVSVNVENQQVSGITSSVACSPAEGVRRSTHPLKLIPAEAR